MNNDNNKIGYHAFMTEDGERYGSFEVFQSDATSELGAGFFWWACMPGCLPDGDASGPFDTSLAAYADALGHSPVD